MLLVGASSLLYAFQGLRAYSLLESAYELTLVGLFVPLTAGLFWRRGGSAAALAAMAGGVAPWVVHLTLGWEHFLEPVLSRAGVLIPNAIGLTATSALGYLLGSVRGRTLPAAGQRAR